MFYAIELEEVISFFSFR